jgi:hypothetical protein
LGGAAAGLGAGAIIGGLAGAFGAHEFEGRREEYEVPPRRDYGGGGFASGFDGNEARWGPREEIEEEIREEVEEDRREQFEEEIEEEIEEERREEFEEGGGWFS